MSDLTDIVSEFLIESHENLDQLDRDLVALEHDPADRTRLASIFRTIHTIKGTSGFLGFGTLEAVTHAGESLLSKLRDGALQATPEITSGLLALVDAVRHLLRDLEATGSEGNEENGGLIERLRMLSSGAASNVPPQPPAPTPTPAPLPVSACAVDELRISGVAESSVRVDIGLLDQLMNLVGELVVARNEVLQQASSDDDDAILATAHRLDEITSKLHAGVMKTRMQPIGASWNKIPRIARDLAQQLGKQVRVEMEGRETELDRAILESIRDPLTHLVRNAVDHGIESPEVRAARGKPIEGRLLLRAFHESGRVNIVLSDDGGGLDANRITAAAVRRGLLTPEQAARASERDLLDLIFKPGLSTVETVTNLSGRGVGMDVVKTNIEKIGGRIEIQSRAAEGTTIRLEIPLTLAILPALTITAGGSLFAIPRVSLLELIRLEGAAMRGIESIHGALVFRYRGALIPLIDLERELELTPEDERELESDGINIVVLEAGGRPFGLIADALHDTQEIVVKPLGKPLDGISVFSGVTILGDGSIALILDVLGLAQRSGVLREALEPAAATAAASASASASLSALTSLQDQRSLLVVTAQGGGRLAIPLHLVERLEEIAASSRERIGGREVAQVRGRILPLLHLAEVLGGARGGGAPCDTLQVVVIAGERGSVGLVVECILDIVDESIDGPIEASTALLRPGILGAAIIGHRATELLDASGITRNAPQWLGPSEPAAA